MKSLFQLVADYRHLQELDAEEVDAQTLADTLEGLGGEITVKATNVASYARNLETFADTIDKAIEAMQKRAESIRLRAKSVRGYLLNQLQGAGITKVQSPEFTISIRKNPVAVFIATDAKVPEKFMVTPPAPPPHPDKKALKAAIEAGETIDGVHLEQALRLDIR